MKYRDIAGQNIEVGKIICYAALWSRSATLRYARVMDLKERDEARGGWSGPGPTLRVRAVDRKFGSGSVPKWTLLNRGNVITLGFLDRLLVVPEELVPSQALKILSK